MARLPSPLESQDCGTLVQWFRLQYPAYSDMFLFLGTEAKRGPKQQAELKRHGYIRGTPDYFLALPRQSYCGYFLEMKRQYPKGRVTQEQAEMHLRLFDAGYRVDVAWGFEEAQDYLTEYMIAPKTIHGLQVETEEEIAFAGGRN